MCLTCAEDIQAWGIEKATVNADYALEKNLRSIQLMSDTLAVQLREEMAINREFVSNELNLLVLRLNEILEERSIGFLEIRDFAVLDMQNFINQMMPLKKDQYLIRRIEGYGVMPKMEGTYDFVFYGNAFQPGRRVKVEIAGTRIDSNNVIADRIANTLQFSLPVNMFEGEFMDDKISRKAVKISVWHDDESSDPFYEYNGTVLLLPKYPIRYVISEKFKEKRWTGPKDWEIYQKTMGPTGKNGKWDNYTFVCHAPTGTRFTRKHSVETNGGGHSRCDDPVYSSDTRATVNCANQVHDSSRTATARLEYQRSEDHITERKLIVEAAVGPEGLLTYGTHFFELANDHQTYVAEFVYFNGKKITLHSQKPEENGIKVIKDISADGGYKRLIVEIVDPLYN